MTDKPRSEVVAASDLPKVYNADKTVLFVPGGIDVSLVGTALPIESVDHSGGIVTVYVVAPDGSARPIPVDPYVRVRVVYR